MNLTMIGRLADCVLLSYRTPAASVAHLLPEGLELVTRGPWAFWNVVACRVEAMRPKLFGLTTPRVAGVTYHHVGYRLLVQAMTHRAEVRKGLFFLRSDADAAALGAAGNLTTDFKFHPADITLTLGASSQTAAPTPNGSYTLDVVSRDGGGDATLRLSAPPSDQPARLAPGSCFSTLQDACEFLKYSPYALSLTGPQGRRRLRLAEVQRDESAWIETVMNLDRSRFAFFEQLGQSELVFELATRVDPMDYTWKLGRSEALLGQHSGAAGMAAGDVSGAQIAKQMLNVLSKGYGRDHERECDSAGLRYMVAAGYHPQGMVELLQVLAEAAGGKHPPAMLSTHPHPEERIGLVEKQIQEMFPDGVPEQLLH